VYVPEVTRWRNATCSNGW